MFELPKNETKRKGTNIKKCKKNWKTKKRWWPKRDCYQYHYQHKQNTNQHHHRRRRHHKKRKTNPPHFQQYFQRWRLRWRRWWWLWKAKAIATNPQFYNKVTLGSRLQQQQHQQLAGFFLWQQLRLLSVTVRQCDMLGLGMPASQLSKVR